MEKTLTGRERSSSRELKSKEIDSKLRARPTGPSADPKQRTNKTKEVQRKPAEKTLKEEEKRSEARVSKVKSEHGVSLGKTPERESDAMEKSPAKATPKQEPIADQQKKTSEKEFPIVKPVPAAPTSDSPEKVVNCIENAKKEANKMKESPGKPASETAKKSEIEVSENPEAVQLANSASAKQGVSSVQRAQTKPTSVANSQPAHTAPGEASVKPQPACDVPGANRGHKDVVGKAQAQPTLQGEKFNDKLARFNSLDAGSCMNQNEESAMGNVPVKSTSHREKFEGKSTFSIAPDAVSLVNPKRKAATENAPSKSASEETRVTPEKEIKKAAKTQPHVAEPTTYDEEKESDEPTVHVECFQFNLQGEKKRPEEKKSKKVHMESSKNRMTKCSARDCGIYRPLFNFTACGGCQSAFYCNATCQRKDWKYHSSECAAMKKAAATATATATVAM